MRRNVYNTLKVDFYTIYGVAS